MPFSVAVLVTLVLVSFIAGPVLELCFGSGRELSSSSGVNDILKTLVKGTTDEVKQVISRQGVKASITQLQKLELPREVRRTRNRIFVRCLADGQAKAFTKLKKFPNKEAVQQVLDDHSHSAFSCKGKLQDSAQDLKDSVTRKCNSTTEGVFSKLTTLRKIATSYTDLVRDVVLVVLLIVSTTGGSGLLSADILLFQNVVIWILIGTIVVPLFISAISTSAKYPLTVFGFQVWRTYSTEPPSWWKMFFIRTVVFVCYIFVPGVLIKNMEEVKLKRTVLEKEGKDEYERNKGIVSDKTLHEQEQIDTYLDDLRKSLLIFKRNEMSMELVVQQTIQLTMLILSTTQYPVATGLQGMFSKDFSNITSSIDDNLDLKVRHLEVQLSSYAKQHLGQNLGDILLLISVSWSFRTGVVAFLKIHSEEKAGMLSAPAKAILGLRALLFYVTRIICIVAFFAPFLGLRDILAHWHAEGIQLESELLENLRNGSSYWDRDTIDLLFRKQDLANYTLVSLQVAFFLFLGILLLHGVAIVILKMNLSSHFASARWLKKIGHTVESLHVPDVYKDFDVDVRPEWDRTPFDYRINHDAVQKETFGMTSLQMVSNFLLLIPLSVTGEKKD